MHRFVTPSKESWTPEQSLIESASMDQRFRRHSQLEFKDERGTILGPYSPLYYTPNLIHPFIGISNAVLTNDILTPRERELAMLAMISTNDAAYPLYAHSQIALDYGFSRTQVECGVNGKIPPELSHTEEVVYELAREIAGLRGQLGDESFWKAEKVLGQERIAALIHLVAVYLYVALLCNVSEGIVPKPREGVFLAKKERRSDQ